LLYSRNPSLSLLYLRIGFCLLFQSQLQSQTLLSQLFLIIENVLECLTIGQVINDEVINDFKHFPVHIIARNLLELV
jgi:hypothetical protein